MIKVTELRIGNWFATEKGDLYQVNIRSIRHTEGMFPIPLTPEWLERCGFEKGCLVRQLNEDWLIYYNDGLWFQVEKQTDRGYICERIPLFHIKNLHQLQNFYHALTGEELLNQGEEHQRSVAENP